MAYKDFAALVDAYLPDRDEASKREAASSLVHPSALPAGARQRIGDRIDLHGLTLEEACRAVDRFLKQAAERGLSRVLIIHGKGRGVLREGVRRYLEGHPLAGKREDAPQSEGGQGALLVLVRKKAHPRA